MEIVTKAFPDIWVGKLSDILFFYHDGAWNLRENIDYVFSQKPSVELNKDLTLLRKWTEERKKCILTLMQMILLSNISQIR
jgi:hypothetical protein